MSFPELFYSISARDLCVFSFETLNQVDPKNSDFVQAREVVLPCTHMQLVLAPTRISDHRRLTVMV